MPGRAHDRMADWIQCGFATSVAMPVVHRIAGDLELPVKEHLAALLQTRIRGRDVENLASQQGRLVKSAHRLTRRAELIRAAFGGLLMLSPACSRDPASVSAPRLMERDETQESSPVQPLKSPTEAPMSDLRMPDGRVADVRIFQFTTTRLYVPTNWLGDLPVSPTGVLRPALGRDEPPGVVHYVIESPRFARYSDVGIDLSRARTQIRTGDSPSYLVFWKMRSHGPTREAIEPGLSMDRLISSKDHKNEDVFVRVRPDIAVRLNWRPRQITGGEWQLRIDSWRAPVRRTGYVPKANEIGAWAAVVGTPEWQRMTREVRALTEWLSTPPSMRRAHQTFNL